MLFWCSNGTFKFRKICRWTGNLLSKTANGGQETSYQNVFSVSFPHFCIVYLWCWGSSSLRLLHRLGGLETPCRRPLSLGVLTVQNRGLDWTAPRSRSGVCPRDWSELQRELEGLQGAMPKYLKQLIWPSRAFKGQFPNLQFPKQICQWCLNILQLVGVSRWDNIYIYII